MERAKHTLNELLVSLFNYILYIEEKNLKEKNVPLTMHEVHTLQAINKAEDNSMTHIARVCMVSKSTLTSNISNLEKKGYVVRFKDEKDKRINRVTITDKAYDVLKIHDKFHENMINKTIGDTAIHQDELLMATLENWLGYFRAEYEEKTSSEN